MLIAAGHVFDGHLWHVLGLASWVPIFGVIVAWEKWKQGRSRRARPAAPVGDWPLVPIMAVGAACSALVHLAVTPDHLRESIWYGAFFLGAAVAQMVLAAVLVWRPRRSLVLAGAVASALMVGLWLITRTAGIPVGAGHGRRETFGPLDVLASTAEAVSAVAGLLAVRAWANRPVWPWRAWGAVLRGAAAVCVTGTVVVSVISSRT